MSLKADTREGKRRTSRKHVCNKSGHVKMMTYWQCGIKGSKTSKEVVVLPSENGNVITLSHFSVCFVG
jgi:hypothetical protein